MAGFIRVKTCCCCGGSLRGATITIGVFYLLLAILGVTVGSNPYWDTKTGVYGICEEFLFLPLLRESSIVSGIVSLMLVYGAITSKSAFVGPWLAWNIAYPFIQLAHIVWAITTLARCAFVDYYEFETTIIVILSCNVFSLAFLLYFAVVVYSLYKDFQEEESKNGTYGAKILLPSKNWDEEMSPYTRYDPSAATPMNWGALPPSRESMAAPQKPKSIYAGIPRPQAP